MRVRHFRGNFGSMKLSVDHGGIVHGTYGDEGAFQGRLEQGIYTVTWKNGEEAGRLQFEISAGKLTGQWKRGMEEGTMRGKWIGSEIEPDDGWHVLHDLGAFISISAT